MPCSASAGPDHPLPRPGVAAVRCFSGPPPRPRVRSGDRVDHPRDPGRVSRSSPSPPSVGPTGGRREGAPRPPADRERQRDADPPSTPLVGADTPVRPRRRTPRPVVRGRRHRRPAGDYLATGRAACRPTAGCDRLLEPPRLPRSVCRVTDFPPAAAAAPPAPRRVRPGVRRRRAGGRRRGPRVFTARPVHRTKAHLWLSALRHRVRDLGDRAETSRSTTCGTPSSGRTTWRSSTRRHGSSAARSGTGDTAPRSCRAAGSSPTRPSSPAGPPNGVGGSDGGALRTGPATRGLADGERGPARWRVQPRRAEPAATTPGATTLGLPDPWWPTEDEVDDEVRLDLDQWDAMVTARPPSTGRPAALRGDAPTRPRQRSTISSRYGSATSGRTRTPC